jgi:hypothetical protein
MEKKQEIIRIIKKYRDTEYLDTAADEILRLFDVSSSFSEEYSHNCMMYLDKQRTCMVCGKQNCC